jgi:hypothetical protein
MARTAFEYNTLPTPAIRKKTDDGLNKIIGSTIDDKIIGIARTAKEAIDGHAMGSADKVKATMSKLFEDARELDSAKLTPETYQQLHKLQELIMNYEQYATKDTVGLSKFINTQSMSMEARKLVNSGIHEKNVAHSLDFMKAAENSLGGGSPIADDMAAVLHFEKILANEDSPFRAMLGAAEKKKYDSLQYLMVSAGTGKAQKKTGNAFAVGAASALIAKSMGESTYSSLMTGITAAGSGKIISHNLPEKAKAVTAGVKAMVSKGSEAVSSATKKIAPKAAAIAGAEEVSRPSALGRKTEAVSSEEIISTKRLKEHKETQAEFRKKEKEKKARGER